MTFTLEVDLDRWHAHLAAVRDENPGLVPVVKGNGYGFGVGVLARAARRLGVTTVAVGHAGEIAEVRRGYDGDVLVLEPLTLAQARRGEVPADPRLVWTVGRLDVLRAVTAGAARPRVVVEVDSPVHRHGVGWAEFGELREVLRDRPVEGVALHLPLRRSNLATATAALRRLEAAGVPCERLWVSHVQGRELRELALAAGPVAIRPRVGTALWLGAPSAVRASGTVLDTRPLRRGEALGYRQRRAGTAGTLVVVSGGTAHGVGLSVPVARGGVRSVTRGALAGLAHGAGLSPSPFWWAGRRLRFADVPHMQVSMLVVPRGMQPPDVGQRLTCDVRMTVSTFDEVVLREEDHQERYGQPATPRAS